MKRVIIVSLAGLLLCSSCVTLGKYEALEAKNLQIKKEHNVTKQELKEMREENAELLRQNQGLSMQVTDLTQVRNDQYEELQNLRKQIDNQKLSYDTIIENYLQQISSKNRDLSKANDLLTARTKEINDREIAFQVKESEFVAKQAQLEQRQKELEQQEAATKRALAAKQKELEQLRTSVSQALTGFTAKGLQVETRDGKVYVSMESKLMFASGSWAVSKEGAEAIKSLAKVLEENKGLNIIVEGHTDNDAYRGSANTIRDNWDLSVMRATAIVKMLLEYGPGIDPARIEACGHAEFDPKVPNNSAANKAQNRRTEIILSPDASKISKLVNTK